MIHAGPIMVDLAEAGGGAAAGVTSAQRRGALGSLQQPVHWQAPQDVLLLRDTRCFESLDKYVPVECHVIGVSDNRLFWYRVALSWNPSVVYSS